MKRMYFFALMLFIAGIAAVTGQATQTLTQGQIFTGNMTPGAVHTYRMQLRNDAEYFISWDDSDTNGNDNYADLIVGIRGEQWGQYLIDVQDSGNYGQNLHRLVNRSLPSTKRNPLNISGSVQPNGFNPNSEYIIEVRGYSESPSGTYRIVFY
jgi:hypothetical protein